MSKWQWSLKYDPGQPRIPSGNPEGGRWTSAGAAISVDGKWPSVKALEESIRDGTIGYDEEYILDIGGTVYQIKTEGWWDDCMESRDMGETSIASIRDSFEDLMVVEAGWGKADIAGYLSETEHDPPYGVSYIGREV